MTAQIVSLRLPSHWARDWSQQELAEFYRVESALIHAGLALETSRGVSDEGDPWFAFCRSDSGDVFIHFARIDGEYVIDGGPFDQVVRGQNFRSLVRELIGKEPLAQARGRSGSNILFHPAALLIALVGGAFFHSGEAKAAEGHPEQVRADLRRQLVLILSGVAGGDTTSAIEAAQAVAILTGVAIGLNAQTGLQTSPVAGYRASEVVAVGTQALSPEMLFPLSEMKSVASSARSAEMTLETGLVSGLRTLSTATFQVPASQSHGFLLHPEVEASPVQAPPPLLISLEESAPAAPLSIGRVEMAATDNTDAVQAFQLAQAIPDFNPETAPRLLQLPSILTAVISQDGQSHTISSGAAVGLGIGSESGDGHGAGGAATPVETGAAPAAQSSTAMAVPEVGTSSTAPTSSVLEPNSPIVTAALDHFISEIQIKDVVISGQNIVIYDGAILNSHICTPLDSLTFTFADGSSLSLVGTAVEINSLHYVA